MFPSNGRLGMQNSPKKKPTKTQKVIDIIIYVLVGIILAAFMYIVYYHESTGLYPISLLNEPANFLPPKMGSQNQTYEQVIDFVRSDDTDKIEFGTGFNCVDATFRMWRNATWKGISAYPIVIQYDEPLGHMIILFPTKDQGDIFIEPQNDWQVRPRVTQNYNGRKVRGFYVLDYDPIPLDNSPPYDFNIRNE